MFSATFPDSIQRLAAEFLHEYLFLSVGIIGGASSDVAQTLLQVKDRVQNTCRKVGPNFRRIGQNYLRTLKKILSKCTLWLHKLTMRLQF